MHTISFRGKEYKGPSKWSEMSRQHVLDWLRVCNKDLKPGHALRLATMLLFKIKPKEFWWLNSAQQIQLIDELTWLGEGNELTRWMKPVIWRRLRRYIGPEHRLANATIGEFRMAELFYSAYQVSYNDELLDQLIATLYRPTGRKHPDNDRRVHLTDIGVRERAARMRGLPELTRKLILFNYEGCRCYILRKYPTIFKAGDGEAQAAINDLEGVIKTVAGGKFGTFNETNRTPLYLFLDHLRDEIEEAERIKQQSKQR